MRTRAAEYGTVAKYNQGTATSQPEDPGAVDDAPDPDARAAAQATSSRPQAASDPARIYGVGSTSLVDRLGIEGAVMAFLLERIGMMQDDLTLQVAQMQQTNQLKKLYNEKLSELNDMLTELGNQKKSGDQAGTVHPKGAMTTDWDEGLDANGNPTLTAHNGGELLGTPNSDGSYQVTPDAVKAAIEKLRGRVDSLNTDGEINNLRMQSYFRSIETAVSETSQLIKSKGDLQHELARNIA
jgi:hypothetical protein